MVVDQKKVPEINYEDLPPNLCPSKWQLDAVLSSIVARIDTLTSSAFAESKRADVRMTANEARATGQEAVAILNEKRIAACMNELDRLSTCEKSLRMRVNRFLEEKEYQSLRSRIALFIHRATDAVLGEE